MNRDPHAWQRLGQFIRNERERQGLSRSGLGSKAGVSGKSVQNAEAGEVPKRHRPPTLVKIVTALGWAPESIDRVLDGEEPVPAEDRSAIVSTTNFVSQGVGPATLYPTVVSFGRLCVKEGGDPQLRDAFEEAAEALLRSVPSEAHSYTLAAYRPHAAGEGVPADDAERIFCGFEQG